MDFASFGIGVVGTLLFLFLMAWCYQAGKLAGRRESQQRGGEGGPVPKG